MASWVLALAIGGAAMWGLLMVAPVRRRLNFQLTASAYSQKRDLAIDGIRGIVSSVVVLAHFNALGPYSVKVAVSSVSIYAVSMFAAMSGYVLYGGFSRFKELPEVEIKSYLVRRFFRIYPLYCLYFAMTLVGVFIVSEHVSPRLVVTLLSDALMLDNLHFGWRIASPTWSLYPEMVFSVLLPLWVLFARRNWRAVALGYVGLAVFAWAATPNGPTDPGFNLLRYFFLGMVLEHFVRWRQRAEAPPPSAAIAMNAGLGLAFALGIVASVSFSAWGNAALEAGTLPAPLALYRHIGASFHQDLCIWLLVPPILLCPPLRRLFSCPPLVFLGVISYGVYILHEPMAFLLNGTGFTAAGAKGMMVYDLGATATALGGVALPAFWLAAVCVATIGHFVIERPMISWGYAMARRC